MKCQRQILDVCWWARVSNAEVIQRSGLSTVGDIRGGSRILQGRVSNPSERGTGGPLPQNFFLYFLQQNEFLRIPGDIYGHCNCKPLR